jgi:hypothetical protein
VASSVSTPARSCASVSRLLLSPFASSSSCSSVRVTIASSTDGDPLIDLSAVTRDQASALQEITVEEYTDGRGEDKRNVKRIKVKTYDKRATAMDLARLLGHLVDKHESAVTLVDATRAELEKKYYALPLPTLKKLQSVMAANAAKVQAVLGPYG